MTIRTGQFSNDEPLDIKSKGILNAGAISGVSTIGGVTSITFGSGTTFTASNATTTDKGLVCIRANGGLEISSGEVFLKTPGNGIALGSDGKLGIKVASDQPAGVVSFSADGGIKITIPGAEAAVTYPLIKQRMADRPAPVAPATDFLPQDVFTFADFTYSRIKSTIPASRTSADIALVSDIPPAASVSSSSVNLAFLSAGFTPRDISFSSTNSGKIVINQKGLFALAPGSTTSPDVVDASTSIAYIFNNGNAKLTSLQVGSTLIQEGGLLTPTQKSELTGGSTSSADLQHSHPKYALLSSLSSYVTSQSLATTLASYVTSSTSSLVNYYTQTQSNGKFAPLASPSFSGTATFSSLSANGTVSAIGNISCAELISTKGVLRTDDEPFAFKGKTTLTKNAMVQAGGYRIAAPVDSKIFEFSQNEVKSNQLDLSDFSTNNFADLKANYFETANGEIRTDGTWSRSGYSYIYNISSTAPLVTNSSTESLYVVEFLNSYSAVSPWSRCDIIFRRAHGQYASPWADVAEAVPVQAGSSVGPANVLEIGSDDETVSISSGEQYSLTVAGVCSSDPALILGLDVKKNLSGETNKEAPSSPEAAPVALAGRVPCKVTTKYVDAEGKEIRRPIKKGFMLVSSSIPGHAMAADPSDKGGHIPQGTVLGKAMQDWDPAEDEDQEGVIKVWVNLC